MRQLEFDYEWKSAARIPKGLDAQWFGALVESIHEREGEVRPENIVAYARLLDNHPLKDYFVWDDAIAGEHYRLDQARYLLRHLVIRVKVQHVEMPESHPVCVRATFAVRSSPEDDEEEEGGYTLSIRSVDDAELREKLIRQMRMEFAQVRQKWAAYLRLWGYSDKVDAFFQQLDQLT